MAKKKLTKEIDPKDGNILTITEVATNTKMVFDFGKLPSSIQKKFGPFGFSSKLGDAAAGKAGKDAVDAIQKVHKGLMEENWSVRAPAAPKVSKKEINEKIDGMSAADQKAARALLEKLGMVI